MRIENFHSELKNQQLKVLQNLPNLLELQIVSDACNGEKLHFKEGSFPKLNLLKLQDLKHLSSLIIEKGALPSLENLHIGPCPHLKKEPNNIQQLKKLKYVMFYDMPSEFVESILQRSRLYRNIKVVFSYEIKEGNSRTFNLSDPDSLQAFLIGQSLTNIILSRGDNT